MPGVNLDFLPASQAPEALGSPDSACAESGLEEVIGDLLAQEEVEDEEEQFDERKFESTLRCAVGEIHCDLQAFGKRVDGRLEKAASQVAPLAEAMARLQEENQRLRIQQERLVRQVEALCQLMGLPDPLLHELSSSGSSQTTNTLSTDSPSCTTQATPPITSLDTPSNVPKEPASCPQDSDSVSTETNTPEALKPEPAPVSQTPAFLSRRSLSAPSLTANVSCNDSTVLLSVNGSDNDGPFLVPLQRR